MSGLLHATRSGRATLGSVGVALLFVLSLFAGPAQAAEPTPTGGVISGTVSDSTGHGIDAVPVIVEQYAANQSGVSGWSEIPQSSYAGGARPVTAADGTWSTTVPAGTYRLAFLTAGYEPLYYSNASTVDAATSVIVAPASTTPGLDVTLVKDGIIQGKVTNPNGTLATFSGHVEAYQLQNVPDPRGGTHSEWVDTGYSSVLNAQGFEFALPHGDYRLQLVAAAGDRAPLFYPAAPGIDTAADVTVTSEQTTTANFALPVQGTVAGTVLDGPGHGVPNADIQGWVQYVSNVVDGVKVLSTIPVQVATSISSGAWSGAIDARTWRFEASASGLPTGWYLNAGSYATATDVPVARASSHSGIDFRLGVVPGPAQNTVLPSISGTAGTSQTLTADPGVWTPTTGVTFSYQWLRNGAPITGATHSTYKTGLADLSHMISVRVQGNQPNLSSGTATSAQVTIKLLGGSTTPANTALPTITGTPQVGNVLTASQGTWKPAGSYAYQWLVGGVAVPNANQSTYTPQVGDVGSTIAVRVYDTANGLTGRATSGATAAVTGGPVVNNVLPSVTGTPVEGSTLIASPGTWTPSGTTFSYQWLADGVAVPGATGTTYQATASDVGKTLSVHVSASKTGYVTGSATSVATPPIAAGTSSIVVSASPRISGVQRYHRVLTATIGSAQPSGTTTTLQWYRNGHPIAGARSATYKIESADLGRSLAVVATYAKSGYTSVYKVSSSTPVIKSLAKVKLKIKTPGRRYAIVTIKATAPGVSNVTGLAQIYVRGQYTRSVHLRHGKATVRLTGLPKGKMRFDVLYFGSATVSSAKTHRTARVR